MAGWLESFEQLGGKLIDKGGDALAARLKHELEPEASAIVADKPERQYDTQIVRPATGPESRVNPALAEFSQLWGRYKWVAAGGLALVALLAIRGAR